MPGYGLLLKDTNGRMRTFSVPVLVVSQMRMAMGLLAEIGSKRTVLEVEVASVARYRADLGAAA